MTYTDKASCGSSPPCITQKQISFMSHTDHVWLCDCDISQKGWTQEVENQKVERREEESGDMGRLQLKPEASRLLKSVGEVVEAWFNAVRMKGRMGRPLHLATILADVRYVPVDT